MTRILNRLSSFLPDGSISNRLRCWRHNMLEDNPFQMKYRNGLFILKYREFTLRFHENPFSDLGIEGPGYFLKRSVQPGDTIVDAGAYVGALTVLMAMQAGSTGQVIAFEPDPINATRLHANLALNELDNVTVIEKGLWSHEQKAPWVDSGSHLARVGSEPAGTGVSTVPLTSLDAVLSEMYLPQLDFIKMDIEGAELRALDGARNTLQTDQPHVAIASYHACKGGVSAPYVEEYLQALGYRYETGNPHHLTTWGWKVPR